MTAKEYLRQIPRAKSRLETLWEQVEGLDEDMERIGRGSLIDGIGKRSPISDPMGTMLAALIDKKRLCEEEIVLWLGIKHQGESVINQVDSDIHRRVLWAKYVLQKSSTEMSDETGYSIRHINRYIADGHRMIKDVPECPEMSLNVT